MKFLKWYLSRTWLFYVILFGCLIVQVMFDFLPLWYFMYVWSPMAVVMFIALPLLGINRFETNPNETQL